MLANFVAIVNLFKVKEAKNLAKQIISSIVQLSLPVDRLLTKFFRNKEKLVVEWIRRREDLKCVVEPVYEKSTVDVYSIDTTQAQKLIDLIKKEFNPLLEIDSTLVEVLPTEQLGKFTKWLEENKSDIEYEVKPDMQIRVGAFKSKRDEVYAKFLESLNMMVNVEA